MIIGIGSDLIRFSRIEKVLRCYPEKFPQKILHPQEYFVFKKMPSFQQSRFLTKCFAAKEALLKALGTGLSQGIQWSDVLTGRDPSGRPWGRFEGKALKVLQKQIVSDTIAAIHLTLTDDADFVQAFAIISLEHTFHK